MFNNIRSSPDGSDGVVGPYKRLERFFTPLSNIHNLVNESSPFWNIGRKMLSWTYFSSLCQRKSAFKFLIYNEARRKQRFQISINYSMKAKGVFLRKSAFINSQKTSEMFHYSSVENFICSIDTKSFHDFYSECRRVLVENFYIIISFTFCH